MMKLSYREKIVLLVVIVLTVVLIFVMWPIKLIRANIAQHQKTQASVQEVFDENHRIIAEIPLIEKNIEKIVEDSKSINDTFVVHKENFQIDEYFQEFLNTNPKFKGADKNNFEITSGFSQANVSTGEVTFYNPLPRTLTYPILENADVNGNLLETSDPALYTKVNNSVILESLKSQTVEQHTGSMNVKFTKEALFDFLDALREKETGIRVNSVAIGDYKFNMDQPDDFRNNPETKDLVGFSDGSITFTFYTMQEIQDPVFD